MFIGRFTVRCRPERAEAVAAALVAVETPSRQLPGVVHFDVTRSLSAPDTFVVTEVFEDRAAWQRQNVQAEVAALLALLGAGAAVDGYEWSTWEATPTEW